MKRYEDYKESGVGWIGEIPAAWDIVKVKNAFSIQKRIVGFDGPDVLSITQKGIVKKDITSGEGQLAESYKNYQWLYPGEFAMNHMDLLTGWVDCSTYEGVTSPDYRVFAPTISLDRRFYTYLFQHCYSAKVFYGFGQGVSNFGRWRLPADEFNNFLIPLPPIETQKAISTYLDIKTAEIDSLIEETEKSIELLEEYRKSVISEAVTKGLNSDAPMKDSGIEWIGEIPNHWEIDSLSRSMSMITNGYVGPTRDLFHESGIRYIQSLHVVNGSLDFEKHPYYVSEEWSKKHSRSVLKSGDVLVVQTGAIGNVAYVDTEFDGCNCHALIILRASSKVLGKYLFYCLHSARGKDAMLMTKTGATHPHLNSTKICHVTIPLPPIKEQEEIVEELDKTEAFIAPVIECKKETIEALKELRKSLISEAVTGKFKVPGVI